MSDAIVAKAINSTIGTDDFRGLDEILDEKLSNLDEVLQRNIEDIKEAIMPVSNLSNPVYAYHPDDEAFYYNGGIYNKKVRLTYEGIVAVECQGTNSNLMIKNATLVKTASTSSGGVIHRYLYRLGRNAEFYVRTPEEDDANTTSHFYLVGHTEFAPPLSIEEI